MINLNKMALSMCPLGKFVFNDLDTSNDDYEYYGYTTHDGEWYILRMTAGVTNYKSARYAKGMSEYVTSWNSKTSITYSRYSDLNWNLIF